MSLGASFQWPQYPTAQAVERLTSKGIVVVTSAGNSGAAGEYAVGAPAVGPAAIAVASFENNQIHSPAFLDREGTPVAYTPMVLSPAPPKTGSAELVYVGLGAADADFRNPDGSSKVQGKIALISRGQVSFQEKSVRAKQHGAVAAVVFNNQPGTFTGTLQTPGEYIPTVGITKSDGERLVRLLGRTTWQGKVYAFPSETAGLMSDFSSLGPAPDLGVKPDLMAPGGNIYSTYPQALGSYATISGTSMASPHVAGAAALILQGRKEMFNKGGALVKPTAVRTLLTNTAMPQTEGRASTERYPVYRQGAGMIDVVRALAANARILPEKIALGEVETDDPIEQTVIIENLSDKTETYRFAVLGSHGPAVGLTARALKVEGRKTAKTTIRVEVPSVLAGKGLFSGWVVVINSAGEKVAHIPYLGFAGDYQAATAFDPVVPDPEFPWLARLEGDWLINSEHVDVHPGCECDAGAAWILFAMARQTRELRLEIWDINGRKMGNALRVEYVGRSAGGLEVLGWDGLNDKGRRLPAGTYRLRLMALRPLGAPHNPDHWDIWTSGTVKLIYD